MRILAVCGSLQARSRNLDLLKTAAASAPADVHVDIFESLRDLPHFDADLDEAGVPGSVTRWREALATSDGVLIACPEYAFSLPGVVKNAIDWVVGSGELERKIVAITAATHHADRGRRGLAALRGPLTAVSATIVGGEPIARGPDAGRQVAALVGELVAAIRAGG